MNPIKIFFDIDRPYGLLPLAAIVSFVMSLLVLYFTRDPHIPQVFFYFFRESMYWTIPMVLLVFYLLYLLSNSLLLSKALSWVHIVFTIITALFLVTTPIWLSLFATYGPGMPRHYYDSIGTYLASYNTLDKTIQKLLLILFVLATGQLFYIINLFLGIGSKIKKLYRNKME